MRHTCKTYFFGLLMMGIAAFSGCTKNEDFIEENVTDTGVGYYPLSANTLVDMATNATLNNATYSGGATFRTEIQFISQTPVKEINLYTTVGSGSRTKSASFPYAPAYSAAKGTDTLLVPYTVPTGLTAGTSIKLEYEILNQNSLNLVRSATIKTR